MDDLEQIIISRERPFLFAVETSFRFDDYLKFEELRNEIWEDPEDHMSGAGIQAHKNFFQNGNCLFIGIYSEAEKGGFIKSKQNLVAFSMGYVGVKDKEIAFRKSGNLAFYSQFTAVRPDFRNYNLAVMLKEFQRDKVLNILGVEVILCTYDPLTGINAYRNIHTFGMDVLAYKDSYYTDFTGKFNRTDVPCDRLCMTWDLRGIIQRPSYDLVELLDSACNIMVSKFITFGGTSGELELQVVKDLRLNNDGEFLLVEIPFDFYSMLQATDVEDPDIRNIPVEWRMKTREAFNVLFQRGYKVIDFRFLEYKGRTREFYILKR
jgi:predicted GNAT superfamily acetyltransferase